MSKLSKITGFLSASIVTCTLATSPAHAKHYDDWQHDRDQGHDDSDHHDNNGKHAEDHQRAAFAESDRDKVRHYLEQHHHKSCPPGLAKKHNGCLPPGHAKEYVIGRPLPRTVVYESVPQPLLVELQPPPPGYRYVYVNDDVLLISLSSRNVMDAITVSIGR